MKNLTWQNPEQLFVAQELINKVKSKCCGIKDRVDLSFLKHGFVISKSDLQNNQAFVDSAVEKNLQIKVIFEGNEYFAYCDCPSSTQRQRFMFKAPLKTAFQNRFKKCYLIEEGEIKLKSEVVVNVQFLQTDEENTFEAKQLGGTVIVDIDKARNDYQEFLNHLDGTFAGYVKVIDKKFVQDKVKELYGLPSAYYLTNSADVLSLVEEIRNDPDTDDKDKKASSRRPSCSLKKYAEFLKTQEQTSDNMPFEIKVIITVR